MYYVCISALIFLINGFICFTGYNGSKSPLYAFARLGLATVLIHLSSLLLVNNSWTFQRKLFIGMIVKSQSHIKGHIQAPLDETHFYGLKFFALLKT